MTEQPGIPARPPALPARLPIALLLLCAATSVAVFFRDTLTSRLDLISGNVGDNRLYIVTLEHWLAAVRGEVAARSPIFFWPEPGVLGYTDCVVLLLPPFALGRAVGLDRYLAFQGALVFTKALGFIAMSVLLHRLGVRRSVALLGGALFTISNAYHLAIGHAQLVAVAYVPLLGLLAIAWARWRAEGRSAAARVALAGAAVMLALLFSTSYYIAWFTVLVGGLIAVVAAICGSRPSWTELRRSLPDAGLAIGVLAIALVPFLVVYLPALARVGGRPFEEVRQYAAAPWQVVDVGPDNVVWGPALARLAPVRPTSNVFATYETRRGWPPLLLCLVVSTLLAASGGVRHGPHPSPHPPWAAVLGITAVLAWALATRWGHATPWKIVLLLVPGASAIRVPVRINLVINVLVIAVAMVGLDRVRSRIRTRTRRSTLMASAGFGAVGLALLLEQLNTMPVTTLSRASERAVFAHIPPPPSTCRAFYAVKPATTDIMETARGQIDAMLLAYEHRIPTLNGWSGNQPPGWALNVFDEDTAARALAWARTRGVADGLCELDLSSRRWEESPGTPTARSRAREGSVPPRRSSSPAGASGVARPAPGGQPGGS